MKLNKYINKHYAPKAHTKQGSKKAFAAVIGMSTQQLNNMLYSCKFIVVDESVWRKSSDTIIKVDGEYYVKTHVIPE